MQELFADDRIDEPFRKSFALSCAVAFCLIGGIGRIIEWRLSVM